MAIIGNLNTDDVQAQLDTLPSDQLSQFGVPNLNPAGAPPSPLAMDGNGIPTSIPGQPTTPAPLQTDAMPALGNVGGLEQPQVQQSAQPAELTPNDFAQTPAGKAALQSGDLNGFMSAFQKALGATANAASVTGKAGEEIGKFTAAQLQGQAKQLEQWKADEEKQQQERQKLVLERTQDLDRIGQEMQAANQQKVDNNRYWNNAGTGGKITAGIAILLGGLGQGLTGAKSNAAVDIIQKAIDDDISTQKFNIQEQRQGLRDQYQQSTGMLDQLYKRFGNEDAAESGLRYLALQKIETEIKSKTAQWGGQVAAAKGQEAVALVQLEMQKAKMQFMSSIATDRKLAAGEALNPMELANLPKDKRQVYEERYAPGIGFTTGSKEDRDAMQKYRETAEPGIAGLQETIQFASTYNRASPTQRAQMAVRSASLMGTLRTALGLGTLSEGDKDFLNGLIGNPNNLLSLRSTEVAKLQTILDKAKKDYQNTAKTRGFTLPGSDLKTFKPSK